METLLVPIMAVVEASSPHLAYFCNPPEGKPGRWCEYQTVGKLPVVYVAGRNLVPVVA